MPMVLKRSDFAKKVREASLVEEKKSRMKNDVNLRKAGCGCGAPILALIESLPDPWVTIPIAFGIGAALVVFNVVLIKAGWKNAKVAQAGIMVMVTSILGGYIGLNIYVCCEEKEESQFNTPSKMVEKCHGYAGQEPKGECVKKKEEKTTTAEKKEKEPGVITQAMEAAKETYEKVKDDMTPDEAKNKQEDDTKQKDDDNNENPAATTTNEEKNVVEKVMDKAKDMLTGGKNAVEEKKEEEKTTTTAEKVKDDMTPDEAKNKQEDDTKQKDDDTAAAAATTTTNEEKNAVEKVMDTVADTLTGGKNAVEEKVEKTCAEGLDEAGNCLNATTTTTV